MPLPKKLFPVVAIALGLLLLLYAVLPMGIGLSEDSVSYLAAAHSLNNTGELRDIDGSWFVAWAPLYPLTIAALQHLSFPIEHALAGLNVLVFALTIFTSWLLIERAMENLFFRATCLLFIVCSFTMMQTYSTAWSEPFFLLLINCVALTSYKPQVTSRKFLVFTLLCAMAMLQRYIGIFLILVVVLFLLKREEKISFGKITGFIFISVLPLAIWLARNYFLTETLTGFRVDGGALFQKNILVLADTLTSWLLPIKIPLVIRALVFAGVAVVLRNGIRNVRVHIHALLVATYLLALVASYFLFSFEEPRDRLLAPAFIPFSLLLFSGLEKMQGKMPQAVFAGMICAWMLYPAARIVRHVQLWHDYGVEAYNKPTWKNSETMVWLKEKESAASGNIFSNDPHAIYYFTGKNAHRVPKNIYSFAQFHHTVKDGDMLIWWKGKPLYDLQPVVKVSALEQIITFPDAQVFKIKTATETKSF